MTYEETCEAYEEMGGKIHELAGDGSNWVFYSNTKGLLAFIARAHFVESPREAAWNRLNVEQAREWVNSHALKAALEHCS